MQAHLSYALVICATRTIFANASSKHGQFTAIFSRAIKSLITHVPILGDGYIDRAANELLSILVYGVRRRSCLIDPLPALHP